jgi:hypothetical protein
MSSIKTKYATRNIEFQIFWLKIGNRVGNANLPLVANAENIQEFISDIDSQSNPFREVIQQCYVQAKCQSLNSSINPFLVMDILGESLYKLKHHHEPDVSLIDLIEHVGLFISQEFISKKSIDSKQKTNLTNQATVIEFKNFRSH